MKKNLFSTILVILLLSGAVITAGAADSLEKYKKKEGMVGQTGSQNTELATVGGGCFWCTEAVYERIEGVLNVVSGYAGGTVPEPSYRDVTSGRTGHAEVIQIEYDPKKISYAEVLEIFWKAHDPTTLNRQGADVGTQYRSIILYHDDKQKAAAQRSKDALDQSDRFISPVVTEIEALDVFYPAEDYHQDYFENNPEAGYCRFVINPKLQKLGLE